MIRVLQTAVKYDWLTGYLKVYTIFAKTSRH